MGSVRRESLDQLVVPVFTVRMFNEWEVSRRAPRLDVRMQLQRKSYCTCTVNLNEQSYNTY